MSDFTDLKYGVYKQPSNVERFKFDYKRSEFLECNRTLFESNLNKIGSEFKPDEIRNLKIIHSALNMTKYFDEKLINYWISDGSMLG